MDLDAILDFHSVWHIDCLVQYRSISVRVSKGLASVTVWKKSVPTSLDWPNQIVISSIYHIKRYFQAQCASGLKDPRVENMKRCGFIE